MDQKLLLNQLIDGNERVLEGLFMQYYKVLVIYSNSYVRDRQIAEDLVQDVFVMLFEKRETLDIHTSIKSFLYTSVRNHTLNYLKKVKQRGYHQEISDINEITMDTETSHEVDHAELSEKLFKAIDQLPNQNQNIFKLSRLEGFSNQEIADKMGLTKRTVETHISNALKKLRELLTEANLLLFLFF